VFDPCATYPDWDLRSHLEAALLGLGLRAVRPAGMSWAWQPDLETRKALKRGVLKLRRAQIPFTAVASRPYNADLNHEVRAYLQGEEMRRRLDLRIGEPFITLAGRQWS
jgi:hypothetical protein